MLCIFSFNSNAVVRMRSYVMEEWLAMKRPSDCASLRVMDVLQCNRVVEV